MDIKGHRKVIQTLIVNSVDFPNVFPSLGCILATVYLCNIYLCNTYKLTLFTVNLFQKLLPIRIVLKLSDSPFSFPSELRNSKKKTF